MLSMKYLFALQTVIYLMGVQNRVVVGKWKCGGGGGGSGDGWDWASLRYCSIFFADDFCMDNAKLLFKKVCVFKFATLVY